MWVENVPAKCEHENHEQVHDTTSYIGTFDGSNYHVCKGARKQEKHPHMQEHSDTPGMDLVRPLCVAIEAHWEIPGNETENSHELSQVSRIHKMYERLDTDGIPSKFHQNIRDHKCLP